MTVSSSTSRVQFNGNGSTTVFAYSFKIFDQDDLTVIVRSATGTETVKTITTHYTVSGAGNAGGGNVTMLTAPASGETLTILREQDLVQELNLVENDPFPSQSLEDALDKLTFIVQQHDEELGRSIKASRTNTIGSTEFTVLAADRANKVFAFNSAGELSVAQELGTYRNNWATSTAFAERDIVKDTSNNNIYICVTAHTSTGSQPITTNADAAKWALLVDAASATNSASAAASSAAEAEADRILAQTAKTDAETAQTAAELAETNAETAETNAEAAQTAAEAAQAAAELVYDNFDDRYLGAKATDPTVDNDGDALIDGALYFDTANNVMKVYDLGTTTWLRTTPTSGDQANIDTVSGIAADVTTVAGISSDVTTVAGISSDVTAVVADATDIGTVAADLAGSDTIGTVAGNIANVNTVAGNTTNINTVAGISSDVTTVAGISADVVAAPTFAADAESARDTANLHKLAAEAAATSATNTAAALTGFDLDAIAATKAVTAVDVFVYDTSKDSDGGAWRKRTQGTSWYNETLNTATRGARREFPAVAVIVAESNKVTIYDGDDPALPMWMVFNAGTYNVCPSPVSTISALNGILLIGGNNASSGFAFSGVRAVNFISEVIRKHTVTNGHSGLYPAGVSARDANLFNGVGSDQKLVNDRVNDVAITVLPDAPIDPATGLPVPTIAVATAAGVSVINNDGTVADIIDVAADSTVSVSFNNAGDVLLCNNNRANLEVYRIGSYEVDNLTPSVIYDEATIPALIGSVQTASRVIPVADKGFSFSRSTGLTLVAENPTTPASGMVNYITSSYQTGWMNGDIKGAFLSDTDDTDLVGSDVVTNGGFATDTDWTKGTGWTIASNVASSDGSQTADSDLEQAVTTVVGKQYILQFTVSNYSAGNVAGVVNSTEIVADKAANGSYSGKFTATSTSHTVKIRADLDFVGDIDDVSFSLADADRSVNNNGLIVNGTVTRSPVATGADLVAYSGFSASNYLEQPYNSALDFGTGDFAVMGWVKNQQLYDTFFVRSDGSTSATEFMLQTGDTASDLRFYLGGGFVSRSGVLPTAGWHHLVVLREAGLIKIYSNGRLVDTFANTSNVTQAGATLVFGDATNSASPAANDPFNGSLALWRISATAPTAEQIKKIYNDEKFLFQDGAQATLFGASDAVTALAHDPVTDLLHVGTSAGRSVFQGLRRVSNTTTAVGTAISASNGLVVEE